MERLGLFGGTFDPPHLGHLILAAMCADALDLEAVWFVPAAQPPHKRDRRVTPIADRLAMLTQALADNPQFALSRIDVDRPGPHYSVDMIRLAQAQQPEAEITFLMGGDSLHDLPSWHAARDLLDLCRVAVVRRPGDSVDMVALEQSLPGIRQRIVFVDGPTMAFSASEIAARVREGRSIRYLVPEAVRVYIETHGLYHFPPRDGEPADSRRSGRAGAR
jgi:nicotinate-nucleotide adenylyltransferase